MIIKAKAITKEDKVKTASAFNEKHSIVQQTITDASEFGLSTIDAIKGIKANSITVFNIL